MGEGALSLVCSLTDGVLALALPCAQLVVGNGGISQLASLIISSPHAEVKAEVAGALWALSESHAMKSTIANASTVSPLVQLLGTGALRAREHAAYALGSLAFENEDNQVQVRV